MSRNQKTGKAIARGLLLAGGAGVAAFVGASCASRVPPDLGLVNGKLSAPPSSPNCVCSEFPDHKSYIKPFKYDEDDEKAWARLKEAVIAEGGTIVEESRDYRWFTFTSRIFRFVDDVEFRLDRQAKIIHVRSASRSIPRST